MNGTVRGSVGKLTSEPNIQISNDLGVTEKARKKDIVVDLHTKRESDQDRQRRRVLKFGGDLLAYKNRVWASVRFSATSLSSADAASEG